MTLRPRGFSRLSERSQDNEAFKPLSLLMVGVSKFVSIPS